MIEEFVKPHGSFNIEFKHNYRLFRKEEETAYNLETYIFIPKTLGINETTYSSEQFYADMKTYIRFKTPTILLKDIIDGPGNYYHRLSKSIDLLTHNPQDDDAISEYMTMVKMFCSILKSTIRDHVTLITQKKDLQDRQQLYREYLEHVPKILTKYRGLRALLNAPTISEEKFNSFLFGDEFLSLLCESSTFHLLEILSKNPVPEKEKIEKQLLEFANQEIHYRKKSGYPSITTKNSPNEHVIFRRSALKKFVSSALYLNTRKKKEGVLVEHFLYSVAAGASMIFATLIAFYAQKNYAEYSFALLVALVVGYMGKDRMKDILKIMFLKTLRNRLYDHKFNIIADSFHKKLQLGHCRESFRFIHENKLPSQIKKLRNRDQMTEIENDFLGEHIIHYRKSIAIHSRKLKEAFSDMLIEGITDVSRYNLTGYITKMDDPEEDLCVFEEDSFSTTRSRKVHHVNIISRYTNGDQTVYKRIRAVMTRNGVLRLEEVASDKLIL